MSKDLMRYDKLVEGALRGVVIEALRRTSEGGLPGDHHFYVTFRTNHPGTTLSDGTRLRYPDEMTIVLEHQFWDLVVGDDEFSVKLSFNGVPERIIVPYEAITAFADPSVQFGLKFQSVDAQPASHDRDGPVEVLDRPAKAKPAKPRRKKKESGAGEHPADVVALDSFRKKK
jgi:hypothetical protein